MIFDQTIENTFGSGLVATITTASASITDIWVPPWATAVQVYTSVLAKYCFDGTKVGGTASITNQVQAINTVGTPTGGTFTLLSPLNGVATGTIAHNAAAATIKTAIIALDDFDTGDITAGGGALPTEVTLQFTGVFAGLALPLFKVGTNAVTGSTDGEPVRITQKTAVVNPYAWIEAGTQQVLPSNPTPGPRYLHLVNDSGAGSARVTFLRG